MQRVGRLQMIAYVLAMLCAGCATKGYVQQALGQQGTQMKQRFSGLEAQVHDDTQRLGTLESQAGGAAQRQQGTDARVQTLEGAVGQTRDSAQAAGQRADAASAQANEVNTHLTNLWTSAIPGPRWRTSTCSFASIGRT